MAEKHQQLHGEIARIGGAAGRALARAAQVSDAGNNGRGPMGLSEVRLLYYSRRHQPYKNTRNNVVKEVVIKIRLAMHTVVLNNVPNLQEVIILEPGRTLLGRDNCGDNWREMMSVSSQQCAIVMTTNLTRQPRRHVRHHLRLVAAVCHRDDDQPHQAATASCPSQASLTSLRALSVLQRCKRTVFLEAIPRTWREVNPSHRMPPSFCDRGVILVFAGDHPPGTKAVSTVHQCAMGPTDATNCLGDGPAPECFKPLPPTMKHEAHVAHAFGMGNGSVSPERPHACQDGLERAVRRMRAPTGQLQVRQLRRRRARRSAAPSPTPGRAARRRTAPTTMTRRQTWRHLPTRTAARTNCAALLTADS